MTAADPARPEDRIWMGQALALAALGEGTTRPNPQVGCVLVREGEVVGAGWHREAGSPHAEAEAVGQAGDRARGATAYVNLEPCSHRGRTPPCADLLVAAGVRRVVAAVTDPNPLVNGRGFEVLTSAGVALTIGTLAREARGLNASFMLFHERRRPLVTLKAAVTLDGQISAAHGASRWITGGPARRFAHRLRLKHDAILVGAGTLRRDDPQLTVRLPGVTSDAHVRVVLCPSLELDPTARLFRASPVPPRIYIAPTASASRRQAFEGRAELIEAPLDGDDFRLGFVLDDLAARGVQSLLVEGGGRTLGAFLAQGLADEIALFVAPTLMGAGEATGLIATRAPDSPERAWRLTDTKLFTLGHDQLVMACLVSPRFDG